MLKVLQPNMPTADDLLPYLRRMDASRVYVNSGPLCFELEERLGAMLSAHIAPVSNGTLAIELALRAMDMPPGSLILVPAVTFKATGQAVVNAGHIPILADVSRFSWCLQPETARDVAAAHPIRCVIPVAAFGLAVPASEWEAVHDDTGLHVIIDAAGAIMEQHVPHRLGCAVAFSLHATKTVGCGEGGIVASTNADLIHRVARLAAFGPGGTNAKMSEYHAAVALASLAPGRLAEKSRHSDRLSDLYARLKLRRQIGWQSHRTLFPVLLPDGHSAQRVALDLDRRGIETKRWYWPFLNALPEFAEAMRVSPLPVTDMLAQQMLGLPFHDFMTADDVARVAAALDEALQC